MSFLSNLFSEPFPSISAQELNEKRRSGKRPYLLDVREPAEFVNGHIAGAKLIPLGALSRESGSLPKDREIVCVCASGSRSSSAAKFLHNQGYSVTNLKNGMMGWTFAKLPIEKGK